MSRLKRNMVKDKQLFRNLDNSTGLIRKNINFVRTQYTYGICYIR